MVTSSHLNPQWVQNVVSCIINGDSLGKPHLKQT